MSGHVTFRPLCPSVTIG